MVERTLSRRYSSSRRPVGAALDHADLVVQALDEAECDLVLRLAVGGDAVPVALDHLRELLEGLEPLPLERGAPVLEEAPRPGLALIAPELTEGFLEQVGRVQALVRGEQELQALPALEGQILAVRQQRVLLALDEAPVLAGEPGVLALAHRVECGPEMPQHVELVEQHMGLRGVTLGRIAKRPPHVHHCEADAGGLSGPQPLEEAVHAGLGAVLASKPDRPHAHQIAHHDAVGVPLADRDLVDPDHLRPRRSGPPQLLAHVLHLELLDRVPCEPELLRNVPDRRGAAALADVVREALRVAGIVGQEVQALALHVIAAPASEPAHLELQVDPKGAAGKVADPANPSIVEARLRSPAGSADRFFERRTSVTTRARGSPKMPTTVGRGRKPGKRYESERRRGLRLAIAQTCTIS